MTKAIKICVPFCCCALSDRNLLFQGDIEKLIYCFKNKRKCTQTRIVPAVGLWTHCSAARQMPCAQRPVHMSRVTSGSKAYDIKRFAFMRRLKNVFRTWSSCSFLIAAWTLVWNKIPYKSSFTATVFCIDRITELKTLYHLPSWTHLCVHSLEGWSDKAPVELAQGVSVSLALALYISELCQIKPTYTRGAFQGKVLQPLKSTTQDSWILIHFSLGTELRLACIAGIWTVYPRSQLLLTGRSPNSFVPGKTIAGSGLHE